MKIIKLVTLSFAFFLVANVSMEAQTLTVKQKEYEKNKVQIFTVNERNNLLNWFTERAKSMDLSEAKEDEYTGILIFYFVKMGRLDDKDQGNSKEEILQKMDELTKKQNAEVKEILTKEQYKVHVENFDKLIQSIKNRISETKY